MKSFKIKNKDYILKYNFRAIADIQDKGINLIETVELRLTDIAFIVWVGLKKYHPELSLDDVFDLMDDVLEELSLEEFMGKVSKALEEAMGKQKPSPKKK